MRRRRLSAAPALWRRVRRGEVMRAVLKNVGVAQAPSKNIHIIQ